MRGCCLCAPGSPPPPPWADFGLFEDGVFRVPLEHFFDFFEVAVLFEVPVLEIGFFSGAKSPNVIAQDL